MDYYMGVDLKAPRHVKKRLYLAVVKGDVRAPLNGRIPGREWSKQIAAMNLTTTPSHCRPILNCLSRTLVDHGIEAGFLLTVGELSGGVIHVDALLQNYEARAPRKRAVDEPSRSHGTVQQAAR